MASAALIDDFAAQVQGGGERTVVLGHGFGTDQSVWQPQRQALLAAGYRVVSYDAAGATEHSLRRYQAERHGSLFGFAEDLIALMQALEIRAAHYVGHSAGGMVGLLAANGEPGLFRSLSLLGSSACYLDDPASGYVGGFSREAVGALIGAMRNDYAAWANGFAPLVVANPDRPHLALGFSACLLALRPDIAADVLETIFLADHRQDARRVVLPTQVLQTGHDPAVPLAAAQWLAQTVAARDFQVLEAEGHFPHISAPDRVSDALLGFLQAQGDA